MMVVVVMLLFFVSFSRPDPTISMLVVADIYERGSPLYKVGQGGGKRVLEDFF